MRRRLALVLAAALAAVTVSVVSPAPANATDWTYTKYVHGWDPFVYHGVRLSRTKSMRLVRNRDAWNFVYISQVALCGSLATLGRLGVVGAAACEVGVAAHQWGVKNALRDVRTHPSRCLEFRWRGTINAWQPWAYSKRCAVQSFYGGGGSGGGGGGGSW